MHKNAVSGQVLSPEERAKERQAILAMSVDEIFSNGQKRGKELGLQCTGAVTPLEAWALLQAGAAVLIDIRTVEEHKFVGHPTHAMHVPLVCGPNMIRNPGFLHEVEKTMPKDANILMMCRSGKRSAGASESLSRAGYTQVYNVMEGFEGDLDDSRHRGNLGGWRYWCLDWVQD